MSDEMPLNLTLEFIRGGGHTTIGWRSELLDGGFTPFSSPYGPAELPVVIKALDSLQVAQSFDAAEMRVLERHQLARDYQIVEQAQHVVGEALYEALGPQGAGFIEQAVSHARFYGKSINYVLRFPPECVDLAALPWELLRSPLHRFLLMRAGGQDSCERNVLFGQAPPAPLPDSQIPHALVLLPHFAMDAADRAAHVQIFETLQQRGALTYEPLSPLTADALDTHLRETTRRPQIVHYAGHGTYYEREGWLLFDGAGRNTQRVSAEQFSSLIGPVHLAVIQACQSAMVAQGELLTGVAPALSYAAGAVVAMQLTIRTAAARRFVEILYDELLIRAHSLRIAVAKARRSLFGAEQAGVSWFVPTLYLRVPPQLARGRAATGPPPSERAIVTTPVRELVIPPMPVGPLELTLSRDPRAGQWLLVAHNQATYDVESIALTATRMPAGVQLHPHQVRIPRAQAGERSAPVGVALTVSANAAGAQVPFSVVYRVTTTGQMERKAGTMTIQFAEGSGDAATSNR